VITSVIAFARSHRNDNPLASDWPSRLELPSTLRQLEISMTLALSTVVGVPRTAFDLARPRVAKDENPPHAEPCPAAQQNDIDAAPDIVEEWGRQSFPASDPPANW
jgi:hypothetical protein